MSSTVFPQKVCAAWPVKMFALCGLIFQKLIINKTCIAT